MDTLHHTRLTTPGSEPAAAPAIRRMGTVDCTRPAPGALCENSPCSAGWMRQTSSGCYSIPPSIHWAVAARSQHLPRIDNGIPVVKTDRGGQITYHGPGQPVVYLLRDLQRRKITVRPLVRLMENAVIDLLAEYHVTANGRADAPGVYAGNAKVAALGLRIRNGRCYHGLALNVDMDLNPFHAIDPCGYPGLGGDADARSRHRRVGGRAGG